MGMSSGYGQVPMAEDTKAAQGIHKLLQAEQEAAEVVAAAKLEKVAKLKRAKEEADAEIAHYKSQREQQFQIFSKERSGDSSGHKNATDASTKAELDAIAKQVAANKDTM